MWSHSVFKFYVAVSYGVVRVVCFLCWPCLLCLLCRFLVNAVFLVFAV